MEVKGVRIEGKDLIAVVLVVVSVVGSYTGSVPESVAVTILLAVLSAYGFSSRYHKSKRLEESGGGGR
jgi:uncharacterized ion transporter superfamily protein YfcC